MEIFNTREKESVRYNLKTKQMEKKNEKGIWVNVCHQYNFFYGFRISDIETKDKKFLDLIQLTSKLNPGCKSVSSFISRMSEALIYENYVAEGIKYELHVRMHSDGSISKDVLTKPLEFYSKPIIKFFKTFDIEVTSSIEESFVENYEVYEQLVNDIMNGPIPNDKKRLVFNDLVGYRSGDFFDLINEYKYDTKSLFGYLFNYLEPFEGVDWQEGIQTLHDYYEMANTIGRNVKKYPKYLHSMHDIITANYNSFKKQYNEKKFKEVARPDLNYEGKKYCIIIPETTKDIVSEGTDLNHCVSSYVDKILKKESYIVFLRLIEAKTESLVTVEVIGERITQAKGSYNRRIEKEEEEFLQEYCKKKKLILSL